MLTEFKENKKGNLSHYLMVSNEERQHMEIPLWELRRRAVKEGAEPPGAKCFFRFERSPDLFNKQELDFLSSFLDYLWIHFHQGIDESLDAYGLMISISRPLFLKLLSQVSKSPMCYYDRLSDYYRDVVTEQRLGSPLNSEPDLVFRMIKAPHSQSNCNNELVKNSCVPFQCLNKTVRACVELSLNDHREYEGGDLSYYYGEQLVIVKHEKGSIVGHPPKILHGVTSLRCGVKKTLVLTNLSSPVYSHLPIIVGTEGVLDRFFSDYEKEDSSWSCGICCQKFLKPVSTYCGHNFCQLCLEKWLNRENTCPICRQEQSQEYPFRPNQLLDEALKACQKKS